MPHPCDRETKLPSNCPPLDYKAKIWLYDASLQESEVAFEFSIFRLEESHIPKVGPGDVVFVQFAKVCFKSQLVLDSNR